jgi:hypothetical protein
MMISGFEKTTTNTGYPLCDTNRPRSVDVADVAAIGKTTAWGSATIQMWVRLADETLIGFKACDQSREVQAWSRKVAGPKKLRAMPAGRAAGWRTTWADLPR